MNKEQKELINECKQITYGLALKTKYDSIYFIPTRKKHDSGYNIIVVIGEVGEDKYIIDYCDVIDFESYYTEEIPIHDLHIDCNNGIFHIWSNRQKLVPQHLVSNAVFSMDQLDSR